MGLRASHDADEALAHLRTSVTVLTSRASCMRNDATTPLLLLLHLLATSHQALAAEPNTHNMRAAALAEHKKLAPAAATSATPGATSISRPALKPAAKNRAVARVVLTTLAVQNAAQMLCMRYSRLPSQPKYLTSSAVFCAELLKVAASFGILASQQGGLLPAVEMVRSGVFANWRDTLLVGVPALLYLVQNNLLYVASSHLDAATCQVAYQLKLLTTACFSVALMKRKIPARRWLALFILFIGVVLVQLPTGGGSSAAAAAAASGSSPLLGVAAVSIACVLSGLSGVWLERIVQRTMNVPIWLRNIQLGLLSIVIGAAQIVLFDAEAVRQNGLFQGYTLFTCGVVVQVAFGGLLVGLIMKYADNVIKGFATSLSIVLSSVVSYFIPAFGFSLRPAFVLGSSLVIGATILYSKQPVPVARTASDLEEAAVAANWAAGQHSRERSYAPACRSSGPFGRYVTKQKQKE